MKIMSKYPTRHPISLKGKLEQSEKNLDIRNFPCTGWRTKCHTIDCAHNTFLLQQKTFDIWYRINPHRLENCS